MGTTKHVTILGVAAAAAIAAVAPTAADDHAPRSLRMREPLPVNRQPPRSAPIRRVAQVPSGGAAGNGSAAQPGDGSAAAPEGAAAPGDGSAAQPASDGSAASPGDGSATSPGDGSAAPAPDATPTEAPASPAAPPEGEARAVREDGKTEVISVTDTSVEHELRTGLAPVSVVTRADLEASGHATLGDILQSLPSQANASNSQVNAGGDGTTRINLRGLGASRTLVLLNGHRVVNGGNGVDSAVDINAIPLPMIERVEIIKDGASTMYGADAVGGVVNLVTRPQFDGLDVSLLTSTSQHGDGTEYNASFVTGFTTKDKNTYLVLSAGYQQHNPVFGGDRPFSSVQKGYDFARKIETRSSSLAAAGGRLDATAIGPGGMAPAGCNSTACKPDGHGGWSDFGPNDGYDEAAANYVYTPSARYNVFATGGNRLNDNLSLFGQVLYLHRNSDRALSPVSFNADAPVSKDSLYNPLGGDLLDYRRRLTELGPRQYLDHITMIQVTAGVRGQIPESLGPLKDWKYEISQNYGVTDSLNGTNGGLFQSRVADAVGPSMMYGGFPICVRKPGDPTTQIIYVERVDGRPPILVPCVPLNVLAPAGTIPAEQLKNLTYKGLGNGTDSMHTTVFTANGKVAELPNHGDISLSFGGDYRDEDGDLIPTGIRVPGYLTDNVAETSQGRFHIYDGFGELAIVPISGNDIAKRVEVDLGARALSHSRYGSSLTYKAGGLFRTVNGIAARGTYATAFRAPTVPDLFLGRTESNPVAEDPCDIRPPSVGDNTRTLDPMVQAQCSAQGVPAGSRFSNSQQLAVTGANPALKAETAATATIGVVVEPPQLKGLALSADYWHIVIDNAIQTLPVQTIFANCYDRGIQEYCDQVHRDEVTHRITSVDQLLQNVTRATTSGVDLALWYDTRLVELGRIHAVLEAQYLMRYDLDVGSQRIHGAGFYDLGVYPRLKANLSGNWVHPHGASGGFSLRFVGGYKECAGNDCNTAHNLAEESRDVDRYVKLDLFGGYDFRSRVGKTTLQVGINNVFDAAPPAVYNAPAANSDATTYDFIGRMVYVRMSQLF
jgi:outer membrane receptor protein involved in Fe transport